VPEWVKIRERNEALDLTVYCLAALYILGPQFVKGLPQYAAELARKLEENQAVATTAVQVPRWVERRRGFVTNWRRG